MILTRRGDGRTGNAGDYLDYEFKSGKEIDELARNVEIDSESETVATAIGIIRWLLKNDESVKGQYVFKKKK